MKRIIAGLLSVLLLSVCFSAPAIAEGSARLEISQVSTVPGESVTLDLTLTENPGIAGLLVTLTYDASVLTLESSAKGPLFDGFTAGKNIAWDASANVVQTGLLASFTFGVSANAAAGVYPVSLIVRDCTNEDYEDVSYRVVPGKVTVADPAALTMPRILGRTVIFDASFEARYLIDKAEFDAYTAQGNVDFIGLQISADGVQKTYETLPVCEIEGVEYYYVRSGEVAPKDVNTPLAMELIFENGGVRESDHFEDSVQAALTQAAGEENAAFATAANATLAFCKAAAEAFGKESAATFAPVADVTGYTEIQHYFEGSGAIEFCGTSILLKDELAIKFWAKKGAYTGSLDDLTVRIDGQPVAAVKAENGDYFTFKIDVPVSAAINTMTIELFSGGASVSNRYTDSVLNYALCMTGELAPLGQAIVNYVHYANAYLDSLAA